MAKQPNKAPAKSKRGAEQNVGNWRDGDGHPLKLWRQANNVTLEKIADETGLSRSSLSRIERYLQTPLIGAAQKIIAATHNELKPEDFFV
mgnify:CR=1 FL=1